MKVVQVNISANRGSTGKIAEQIGQTVLSHGGESYFAFGHHCNGTSSVPIKIGTKCDDIVHPLVARLLDRQGLASSGATRHFLKTLEQIKPDIIHLHNIHGYYLNYKLLFEWLKEKKIPTVWTLHDCWPFTGHCAHFEKHGCFKWQAECGHCPALKDYPASWGFDRSRKNFALKKSLFGAYAGYLTLVPVSNWLEAYVRQSFLQKCDIRTIHNGIDIDTFSPPSGQEITALREKYKCEDKTVVIGVAMPWYRAKGYDDFIRLSTMLPSEQYQLVMVGVSKQQKSELPGTIIAIERTQNQDELAGLYSMADLFFNPTYEDNYPTVNLEAIASGTPVLTYRTGGSPEAVTERTGHVIDQGNIEKAATIIGGFRKTEVMAAECRAYAETYFDRHKVNEAYLSLYDEILNK